MAEGLSVAAANAALDALAAAYPWIKPHIGAPGPNGTSNPAAETTRKQATMAAASGGSIASSAQLQWTSVAGSEDWTKFSAWSASSGGTFGYSGDITANPLVAGDTLTIAAGGLTASLSTAT